MKLHQKLLVALFMLLAGGQHLFAQQITINRIEAMPNQPSPYLMRDWHHVATGYDSLVFDFDLTGEYLPLVWVDNNTLNYPGHPRFGLHTVVGTTYPNNAEGVNMLPAVIGASLVGIDKSNQNGYNWVLMCEEHFNKANGINVYLNQPTGSNWDDFWYDTMPNVFFYQLYDLYPNTGDFQFQFTSVADRWLDAIVAMGGRTTPWKKPIIDYRGWSLQDMTGYSESVHEPEAAGALGWLQYNAYITTGEGKYRIGAEWCLEFLSDYSSNPSYELQLPYGTYIAARMNAELGTNYDVEKMVNWCFNVGPLRRWGAVVGTWGDYDCYGLIGQVTFDEYAFYMNTVEQVGALVPMVRYDDRFARAIGKWVLNAANATRLFYPNYLPDENQDSEQWAQQYDPNSYIAHEGMRESVGNSSPYATGDAISGGWGRTNLALYGSSHVGILGGIIDTTNVKMILQLDVLKTDYFGKDAYPTYLYFNPYDETKIVEIDVGSGSHDLYDAVSNSALQYGVSGTTSFSIAADATVLLVVIPSGGTIDYDLNQMLVNGIVVDYNAGMAISNYPPRIKSIAAKETTIAIGKTTTIYCAADDRDGNTITYFWEADGGSFETNEGEAIWTAPETGGSYTIRCIADDGAGGKDSAEVNVDVVEFINHDPVISKLTAYPKKVDFGGTTELTCRASDPDSDELIYIWSASAGYFSDSSSTVTWTAPETSGYFVIYCTVDDGNGGQAADSIGLIVQNMSDIQTGVPIAFYPFNGNADDASGYENHGIVYGATLTADRFSNANSAYYFDGENDYIRVPSSSLLNFQSEISISFWMRIDEFFEREIFPISHGSWENRWKVSIIHPDHKIRWTIKTDDGITDLDSKTIFTAGTFYNVTVLYTGYGFRIYVNGALDISSNWSGLISTTTIDLTIGQILPTVQEYNFKGVLDDIRIYNYTLSEQEIENIYNEQNIDVKNSNIDNIPENFSLIQNFPNPFNNSTTINYQLKEPGRVEMAIYNIKGEKVATLVNSKEQAGFYSVNWNGENDRGQLVSSGIYFYQLKVDEKFLARRKLLFLK